MRPALKLFPGLRLGAYPDCDRKGLLLLFLPLPLPLFLLLRLLLLPLPLHASPVVSGLLPMRVCPAVVVGSADCALLRMVVVVAVPLQALSLLAWKHSSGMEERERGTIRPFPPHDDS